MAGHRTSQTKTIAKYDVQGYSLRTQIEPRGDGFSVPKSDARLSPGPRRRHRTPVVVLTSRVHRKTHISRATLSPNRQIRRGTVRQKERRTPRRRLMTREILDRACGWYPFHLENYWAHVHSEQQVAAPGWLSSQGRPIKWIHVRIGSDARCDPRETSTAPLSDHKNDIRATCPSYLLCCVWSEIVLNNWGLQKYHQVVTCSYSRYANTTREHCTNGFTRATNIYPKCSQTHVSSFAWMTK